MTDVAIIGGGIAGLWTALELLRSGARVALFDMRTPQEGASAAAGGMLAPGAEGDSLPLPLHAFSRASMAVWPDAAKDIEAASDVDVGYASCGSLVIARDDGEAKALKARCARGEGRWLERDDLKREHKMIRDQWPGAAFLPDDGRVDNFALMEALTRAVTNAGGKCHFGAGKAAIRVAKGRVLGIRTNGMDVDAPRVLMAAGAWASHVEFLADGPLPSGLLPPVKPVKGQMGSMMTDALPAQMIVWLGHTYLVPRHTHQLLLGATSEDAGFDESISEAAVERLADGARTVFPALANAKVAERWCGLRPLTPDELPVFGETGLGGLYVAAGQYRNGILFGPLAAKVMAALIAGRTPPVDVSAFSPNRFGPRRGH